MFDQLVEVGRQEFEYQTQVVSVNERVAKTEDVVFVVWIALSIELEREVRFGVVRHGRSARKEKGRTLAY